MFSKQFLIILILLFPFGQLTKIPLFKGGGSLYLHDLLIILYLFIHIPNILANLKQISIKTYIPSLVLMVALLTSLFLALFNLSLNELAISSLYMLRLFSYISFFYLMRGEFKTSKFDLSPYIFINILLTLLLSFSQYAFFPALEPLFAAGWDRHLNRLAGSWLDTGFTGILLLMQLLYILHQWLYEKKIRIQVMYGICMGLLFIALLLTYSRSSYLAFVVSLFVIILYNLKYKILWIGIAAIFAGMLLLPRTFGEGTKLLRTSTILSRLTSWEQGIMLWMQKPAFGHGFNTLRYVKRNQSIERSKWEISHSAAGIENSLIYLMATTGVVGTVSFLWWLGLFVNQFKYNSLYVSTFVALGIHGMFANSWFYPWVILWIGFIYVLSKKLTQIECRY